MIAPIHAAQAIRPCSPPPPLNHPGIGVELSGHTPHRIAPPHRCHHCPPSLLDRFFDSLTAFSFLATLATALIKVTKNQDPGYGSCRAMESPQEAAAFPQPLENAPLPTARVSHISHSPCQRPKESRWT